VTQIDSPLVPRIFFSAPGQDPDASANALTRNAPQPSFPVKSRSREPLCSA
jgi:hypothetical protein